MASGDEAPQPGQGQQVNPELADTPLRKLSGMFKNLFVPAAETIGHAARGVAEAADMAGTKASEPPPPTRATGTSPLQARSGQLPPLPPGRAPSGPLPAGQGRAPSGPLPALPARPTSGPLPRPPARPGTDTLALGTGRLPGQPSSTPPPGAEEPPPTEVPTAAEAERSDKRMAFIVAYMRDPSSQPEFQDRPLVFRIVSEERSYQQNRIVRARQAMDALPAEAQEARAALQMQLDEALGRQAKLFGLLKTLTGRLGRTGGTGFLGKVPPVPPPPAPASPGDGSPLPAEEPPPQA